MKDVSVSIFLARNIDIKRYIIPLAKNVKAFAFMPLNKKITRKTTPTPKQINVKIRIASNHPK
jgi:hypothetical protein